MAIFKYDSVMPVLSKGGSGVKAPSLVAVVNGVQAPIPNVVAGYPTPTDAGFPNPGASIPTPNPNVSNSLPASSSTAAAFTEPADVHMDRLVKKTSAAGEDLPDSRACKLRKAALEKKFKVTPISNSFPTYLDEHEN